MPSFIRWNENTQIWEKAVDPNLTPPTWNHLPIGTPTQPEDTVNKAYVDSLVGGGGFVPYVGATTNVDLGPHSIKATTAAFNINFGPALITLGAGGASWTTSGWSRGIELSSVSIVKWVAAGSGWSWGIGQSGNTLYFVRSTADDNSQPPQYPLILTPTSAVFDSGINERNRSTPIGEWIGYTPQWKVYSQADGVIGNGTLYGRYMIVGKTVFFTIRLVIGSTSNMGTSYWAFTMPIGESGANNMSGYGTIYDSHIGSIYSATLIPAPYFLGIANAVALTAHNPSAAENFVYSIQPFNWAAGDTFWAYGFYEIP